VAAVEGPVLEELVEAGSGGVARAAAVDLEERFGARLAPERTHPGALRLLFETRVDRRSYTAEAKRRAAIARSLPS
jgi:hypothetical protein